MQSGMGGGPGLRPWEIRKLTIPEIALFLDGDGNHPTPPRGGGQTFMSHQEHLAWVVQRRAMTPLEKLEEAMRDFQESRS